jgi:hypothetical protein
LLAESIFLGSLFARYRGFQERYHAAATAMDGREERLAAIGAELEHELRLLGATAIEDKVNGCGCGIRCF